MTEDTGIGGHWEWGVLFPSKKDGPLDRVQIEKSEADAKWELESYWQPYYDERGIQSQPKVVKRWVPNWEVSE